MVDARVTAVRVVNRKTCGELGTQLDWTLVTPLVERIKSQSEDNGYKALAYHT